MITVATMDAMDELASKNSINNVRLNKHGSMSKCLRTIHKGRKEREYNKKVELRKVRRNNDKREFDAMCLLKAEAHKYASEGMRNNMQMLCDTNYYTRHYFIDPDNETQTFLFNETNYIRQIGNVWLPDLTKTCFKTK
jgi:hypothetical protein